MLSIGLDVPRGRDDRTVTPEEAEAQLEAHEGTSVWRSYNNKAQHYDKDLVKDAENTADVLLIFVRDYN